jgi:hypothetical protein
LAKLNDGSSRNAPALLERTARVAFFRQGKNCRILSDRSALVARSLETVEHRLEPEIELRAEVMARPQYMFDRELIEKGEFC